MTPSTTVRAQVAADIARQLSYRTPASGPQPRRPHARALDGQGFYSWIACSNADRATGVSSCDRDRSTGRGQTAIDAQMLPDQAYAADPSCTRMMD